MKRYMLLPEDSIELLRAQDEAEAAVCVFCERTMILFPCSKIEAVSIQRRVTEDRLHPVDCLELLARDTLFDAQQAVLIPVTRQDYPDFLQALEAQCPALLENYPDKNVSEGDLRPDGKPSAQAFIIVHAARHFCRQ